MGRPSKLTEAQWEQVSRRLLAGEKRDDLAREFKISGPAITQRLGKRLVTVKSVANQLVSAESALRNLPPKERLQALDLAEDLRAMSGDLAGAGRLNSANSRMLSWVANVKAKAVLRDVEASMVETPGAPLTQASVEAMKEIAALTRLSNDAASTGLALLAANRNNPLTPPEKVPTGLDHFYGEGDS